MNHYGVTSLHMAEEKARKLKLSFDRVAYAAPKITRNHYGIERQDSGAPVIYYFMQGETDVAFFVPATECLHVNNPPRQWAKEFIDGLRTI